MFESLHHVAIIVSDYARSRRFYTEVLGFEVVNEIYREDRRSYKLDLLLPGVCRIELFTFPNPPPRATEPEACGLRHLAFAAKDIYEVRSHLLFQGISVESVRFDEVTDRKFFFFKDPDGLPIEVYQSA